MFETLVEELQGVEDASKRAAIASLAFGEDAGPRMVNLLDQGTAGIARMRQEARDLGLVIEEELLRDAEAASDSLGTLSDVIGVRLTAAIVDAAPEIQRLADLMISAIGPTVDFTTSSLSSWGSWSGRRATL